VTSEPTIVQDVHDVLRTALTWELPDQRWGSISRTLDELTEALAADDEDAIAEAVMDLERSGPVRGVRSMEGGSASPEMRDRMVRVIDHLERRPVEDESIQDPPSDDSR
jgi:hypothetical protein